MSNSLRDIKVELISSWQGNQGGDHSIAHAAWASSYSIDSISAKTNDDVRRITSNVVSLHHDTPKERVWMEFFITCPIWVERQFDKYRMTVQHQNFLVEFDTRPMGGDHITQNELSGRYRTIPDRFLGMPNDVDVICEKAIGGDKYGEWINWSRDYNELLSAQYEEYSSRLSMLKAAEKGGKITNAEYKRAREVLRGLLGTAFMTDMRICMNLNAFEHIINQRIPNSAQTESRVVAYLMMMEAINCKVAENTINKMVEVNCWNEHSSDILNLING